MTGIRTYFIAIGLAALLTGAGCNISLFPAPGIDPSAPAPDGIDPNNPAIERSTKSGAFGDIQTLRIQIPTGRVVVLLDSTAADATIRVTKTILAGGYSGEQMNQLLTDSTWTAEPSFIDATRFEIEAVPARELSDTAIAFDVQVTLPRSVPTEIRADNAPVEVTGLTANVEIRTANGAVKVSQVTGHVIAETAERAIEISEVSGNVEVRTMNADVTLRVSPASDGFISAETENGNIDLSVAVGTGAALRLDARDGQVSADLSGFQVTDLSIIQGLLTGVLNGGGGKVEARTRKGEIAFIAMDAPAGS